MSDGPAPGERPRKALGRFFDLAWWKQVAAGLAILGIAALVVWGYHTLSSGATKTQKPPPVTTPLPTPLPTTSTSSTAPSSHITIGSAEANHRLYGMTPDQFDVVLSNLRNSGNTSSTTTVKVIQAGFSPTITGIPVGGGRAVNGRAIIDPISTVDTLEIDVSGVGGSGSFILTGFATTVTCPVGSRDYHIPCTLSGS